MTRIAGAGVLVLMLALNGALPAHASDWPAWRGPQGDGVSTETGLIEAWSPAGDNVLWRVDFVGRSTPVAIDGQVCVIGRVGDGATRQEIVACFDAENGRKNWEHRFNVYHTTVPFNRVGWASLAADPETGNIYAHGVAGQLIAYDSRGKLLWSYFLTEEFGHYSGYGGRTQTPLVDGERLILSFVSSGWGDQLPLRHRYFAFDKRTGELLWVSAPGTVPFDFNTQSAPVAADVAGQRLIVAGDSDGYVHAMRAVDGAPVWKFRLSKNALNSTVVVKDSRVYAVHSEENVDEATMGRLVAIDATGSGDVTQTHELWRANEVGSGFPTPALHGGRLYVIDNSANLMTFDAATGRPGWTHSLGTVGKGSPVWADGKLFATEVNGRFHILRPKADGVEVLDSDLVRFPDGHYAEIYASPAIAYGRIFLSTEAGLFCLGDPAKPFPSSARAKRSGLTASVPGEGPAKFALVVPAEAILRSGEARSFEVRTYDAKGRYLGAKSAQWTLQGLRGSIDGSGRFSAEEAGGFQEGTLTAKVGEIEARARLRIYPALPWSWDFEDLDAAKTPPTWIGASGKFAVTELDGNKVLAQGPRERGLNRTIVFFGSSELRNYTIEADVRGGQEGRRRADIGLMAGGYTLDLQGAHQRLELRSWTAELERFVVQVPYVWEPDRWYRLKLRVDVRDGQALVRGKVWPREGTEPAAWTIEGRDELATASGSPGIVAYTPVHAYYDNIKVVVNP